LVDAVSVSLNTADPEQWLWLHRSMPAYRAGGFAGVLHFIRRCADLLPETAVTAVSLPGVNLEACRKLADSLGVRFRIRLELGEPPQGPAVSIQ